jgi:ribosomal protein RSM22 (predicted rRNA methylase)
MLGDGSSLIVQVVPPALLEFSRSVMRSTFSSIMHKRIFTLSFDRSTEVICSSGCHNPTSLLETVSQSLP